MPLFQKLLDGVRNCVTDNYYDSLDAANKLPHRQTLRLGTIRTTTKGNQKEVSQKKLKIGKITPKANA